MARQRNDSIEHDCGNPGGTPLGIFANRVLSPYLSAYNNSIASNPVSAADVDGIRAMLLGAAPSGSRQQAIWNVANGYGRVLAAVLAHEIGHSLGVEHSSPSGGSGDIMNASLYVAPTVTYAFNAGHWALLLNILPGRTVEIQVKQAVGCPSTLLANQLRQSRAADGDFPGGLSRPHSGAQRIGS